MLKRPEINVRFLNRENARPGVKIPGLSYFKEFFDMTKVLTDLSPPALTKAIVENMYEHTPFSHGWPNVEKFQNREISWCLTDIRFPGCNVVFRTRLAPEKVEKTVAYLMAKARRRSIPVQWYITPDTRPTDLGKYLASRGFTTYGDGAGMAIDLPAMKSARRQPDNLNIIEVTDRATLKTWCQIAMAGFGAPAGAENNLYDFYSRDMDIKQPVRFYLGLLNSNPVATSMVYFGAGVAGLYYIATLPEARNRGIGSAMTEKPLTVAREMGYRLGTLQASKMGEPVYRRMGFEEYCRVSSYTWKPKPQ
jgi:GNAT superfamily N-acetyltransferase